MLYVPYHYANLVRLWPEQSVKKKHMALYDPLCLMCRLTPDGSQFRQLGSLDGRRSPGRQVLGHDRNLS